MKFPEYPYIRDMTAAGMPLIYPNSSGTTYPPLKGTSLILPANFLVNGHSYRWNMTSFNGSTEIFTTSSVLYFQTPSAVVANAPSNGSSLPITSTASLTSSAPPPVAGQPNFSSSYYTTANIFWTSGNAPASTIPRNPKLGNALGNCTWYAYGRMLELGNSAAQLQYFTNDASNWANDAIAHKILVDNNPEVGAIAQSVSHHHVAVVESVNGNMVTISESAYFCPNNTGNYLWKKASISSTWFDNYIHVGSIVSSATATSSSLTSGGIMSGVAKSAVASSPQISASAVAPNQTPNSPAMQSVVAKSAVASTPQSVAHSALILSALPNNEGIVIGGGNYVSGSSRTVTAMPRNGYIFENWTENGKVVSSQANYNFTINGNRNLVAHFRPNFMNHSVIPGSPPNSQNQFQH